MKIVSGALVAAFVLVGACGGNSDPAFTGTYPCNSTCAADQFCELQPNGVDGGTPATGTCKATATTCPSSVQCSCLTTACGGSGVQCGTTAKGYVVVCGGA